MLVCVVLSYVGREEAKGRLMGIPVLQICLVAGNERRLQTNWASALKTYEKNVAACQRKMLGLGRTQAGAKTWESPYRKGLG